MDAKCFKSKLMASDKLAKYQERYLHVFTNQQSDNTSNWECAWKRVRDKSSSQAVCEIELVTNRMAERKNTRCFTTTVS